MQRYIQKYFAYTKGKTGPLVVWAFTVILLLAIAIARYLPVTLAWPLTQSFNWIRVEACYYCKQLYTTLVPENKFIRCMKVSVNV